MDVKASFSVKHCFVPCKAMLSWELGWYKHGLDGRKEGLGKCNYGLGEREY